LQKKTNSQNENASILFSQILDKEVKITKQANLSFKNIYRAPHDL